MTRAIVGIGVAIAMTLATVSGCGDDGPLLAPRSVSVRASGCSLVDELATGIVVDEGLVLTVAHVLRQTTEVFVNDAPAKIVAVDHRLDAALISVDVTGPAVRFDAEPAPGLATVAGRAAVVSRIVVADLEEPRDDTTYRRRALVLDAVVAGGQSGAPVVGADGTLLGMVFASSRASDARAYAVTADELAPFVERAEDHPVPATGC